MLPSIQFQQIWSDNDLLEFEITVSDGNSFFRNKVYVGHGFAKELIEGLDQFKGQVHGGIYDLRLGEFGPEYASGAFHARLHFQERGKILVTANAQSDFVDLGRKNVASEATLYLISEPALLDNFIAELKSVSNGIGTSATLQGVGA